MPSDALSLVMRPLLADVKDLVGAHEAGKTGSRGRQWNLAGLNRSIVVISTSAWEAYIEKVVLDAIDALQPPAGATIGATTGVIGGMWPAHKATVMSLVRKFNTPNGYNVKELLGKSFGLLDVTLAWTWQRTTSRQARQRLDDYLNLRHQIAHGVHPRPTVHHDTAVRLADFYERLAHCTDRSLKDHFQSAFGVALPW